MDSLVDSFVDSCIHSFLDACLALCIDSFVASFIDSFIASFIDSCIESFYIGCGQHAWVVMQPIPIATVRFYLLLPCLHTQCARTVTRTRLCLLPRPHCQSPFENHIRTPTAQIHKQTYSKPATITCRTPPFEACANVHTV